MRILLVDDHQLVRYALRMVVEAEEDMEVIGEASNGEEALESVSADPPDVVLLDLRMPGMGGIEVCKKIRDSHPETRVLVLTSFDDDDEVFGAMAAGASGYVMKDIVPGELLDTIRSIAEGRTVLDETVASRIIGPNMSREQGTGLLSPREQDVLKLMAKGMSNRDIARSLWIEETTVKTHVGHILRKLDKRDRAQAVLEAVRLGIVDVETSG